MHDSTLHPKTIARQFRKSDFQPGVLYLQANEKGQAIERAMDICRTGFNRADLHRGHVGGKAVYQHRVIEQALIIRHISESLRRVTGVRQSDRQEIIKSLSRLAGQGLGFNALKLDIKSFYETVNVGEALETLRRDAAFSRQSIHLLQSFFDALAARQITGLPRGLAISATLAEYVMRPFDRAISQLPGVRFYSRFVDDMILILGEDVDPHQIKALAQSSLPSGLALSRSKCATEIFSPFSNQSSRSEEAAIIFLGYRIGVGGVYRIDNRFKRDVYLDIAPSKVRRIKRRLSRAFLSFNDGGPFSDLLDRVKMLTSNHGLKDYDSGQTRYVGLRYNYGLIDATGSAALNSLDRFLLNAVVNTHPSNRLKPILTGAQRKKILGLTFRAGFEDNRFFQFSDDDIRRIIRCWAHA
ncbi:antiviral reverse transcriptase Drt3a [Sphingomonas profundi]|uniref:antiviral reverse transcriptase Drt3a n=1 Tax=Alterirhizorhabdus profundi TaxID=2681549 RepID=UPI0012E72503|nr:antiviral reverse transcriptase Drt3a [Sphingomonas profundi]